MLALAPLLHRLLSLACLASESALPLPCSCHNLFVLQLPASPEYARPLSRPAPNPLFQLRLALPLSSAAPALEAAVLPPQLVRLPTTRPNLPQWRQALLANLPLRPASHFHATPLWQLPLCLPIPLSHLAALAPLPLHSLPHKRQALTSALAPHISNPWPPCHHTHPPSISVLMSGLTCFVCPSLMPGPSPCLPLSLPHLSPPPALLYAPASEAAASYCFPGTDRMLQPLRAHAALLRFELSFTSPAFCSPSAHTKLVAVNLERRGSSESRGGHSCLAKAAGGCGGAQPESGRRPAALATPDALRS